MKKLFVLFISLAVTLVTLTGCRSFEYNDSLRNTIEKYSEMNYGSNNVEILEQTETSVIFVIYDETGKAITHCTSSIKYLESAVRYY